MQKITSTQNPLIKHICKLQTSASARKKENAVLLDGVHLIQEALHTRRVHSIDKLFFVANNHREIDVLLDVLPPEKSYEVSPDVMQKISPTKTPIGIVALMQKPSNAPLTDEQFILLLENIADPGNLGTIIRTGVALGVEAFCLSPGCADVWSPKVLRASQGAHFYTNIITHYDFTKIKDVFDGHIFGTFLDEQATSLYHTKLTGKVALCLGNEGAGISPDLESLCDTKIFIPMQHHFESLNVAIATALCCGEKYRQENV